MSAYVSVATVFFEILSFISACLYSCESNVFFHAFGCPICWVAAVLAPNPGSVSPVEMAMERERERYHIWRNVCFKPFLNSQKRVHRWYRMELIPSLAPPEHRQVLMRSPVFGRAKVPSCFFSLNDTDSAGSSSATSAESGELGTQSSTQTASRNVRQK
jgi:hypothetical protein